MDRPSPMLPLSAFVPESRGPGRIDVQVLAVSEPSAVVPLIAITGESPGPCFVAVAGVHGDEFEGPQAIWEIAQHLRPLSLRGTLLALPICNPWAYAAGLRTSPDAVDGRNLAREFPGNPAGSPTQRLAWALFTFVLKVQPALFLDLHSGGMRYKFVPMVGYRKGLGNERRSRAAARAFGLSALWEMTDHPGTFNTETARKGIPTVGVEMTGAGDCRPDDVAANCEGILNLMRWLAMLRDRPAPETAGPFHQTIEIVSPAEGFAIPVRSVGDEVRAGDLLARILSSFGEQVAEVQAPDAGRIWTMRHLRSIQQHELLCTIARPAGAAV